MVVPGFSCRILRGTIGQVGRYLSLLNGYYRVYKFVARPGLVVDGAASGRLNVVCMPRGWLV
jgi:hypothetical protein